VGFSIGLSNGNLLLDYLWDCKCQRCNASEQYAPLHFALQDSIWLDGIKKEVTPLRWEEYFIGNTEDYVFTDMLCLNGLGRTVYKLNQEMHDYTIEMHNGHRTGNEGINFSFAIAQNITQNGLTIKPGVFADCTIIATNTGYYVHSCSNTELTIN